MDIRYMDAKVFPVTFETHVKKQTIISPDEIAINNICWAFSSQTEIGVDKIEDSVSPSSSNLYEEFLREYSKPLLRTEHMIHRLQIFIESKSEHACTVAMKYWLMQYLASITSIISDIYSQNKTAAKFLQTVAFLKPIMEDMEILMSVIDPILITCCKNERVGLKLFFAHLSTTLVTLERLSPSSDVLLQRLFHLFYFVTRPVISQIDLTISSVGLNAEYQSRNNLAELTEILPFGANHWFFSSLRQTIVDIQDTLTTVSRVALDSIKNVAIKPVLISEFDRLYETCKNSVSLTEFGEQCALRFNDVSKNINSNFIGLVNEVLHYKTHLDELRAVVTLFGLEEFIASTYIREALTNSLDVNVNNIRAIENCFRSSLQHHFVGSPTENFFHWFLRTAVDFDLSNPPRDVLDFLARHIEFSLEIQWPLNSIITPSHLNSYNKLFRFVLQLKLHHDRLVLLGWKESDTRFSSIDNKHMVHLLRFRLLNIISSLLAFFVIQIHNTMRVENMIIKGSSFNDLIANHDSVVEKLLKRTFLHHSSDIVYRAIQKILQTANAFFLSVTDETRSDIDHIADEIDKCHRFLAFLLEKDDDEHAQHLRYSIPNVPL